MTQQVDILVVGGGIVGLSAALAMSERGFSVALIDAGSLEVDELSSERVYAINKASQALLTKLSAWQHLDEQSLAPYEKMYVWDAKSKAHIDFDARLVAVPYLGHIVEEKALKKALLNSIKEQGQNVKLIPHTKVEAIDENAEGIKLNAKEQSWQAKLLMIADGANSFCRQLLKVSLTQWPYHQQALIATIKTEKPHEETAFQVFNPDGPLAFLPLKESNHCSIVWSTTKSKVNHLMALDNQTFNNELEEAFASKLGKVELISQRLQFPLTMRHVKQYAGKSWLLLGDAAHTIHPLAGLGLNLGFADIQAFLDCLDNANNKLSQKALSSYQRQRKASVWQVIAMMEGLKALFLNPLPPLISLRGFGLGLCNSFAPIKRFFIEQASGVS
ncbi:MAG: FAD-dependent oxidoreductase [Proteobacteria bacterium]|nr:FAD-dependent oxidoreductase [Pseudomonadota bacterium]